MTPHRPGFTGSTIDRADHLRLDSARIAELMGSLGARLLRLSTLDPELDEAGRLVWAAGIADDGSLLVRTSSFISRRGAWSSAM